MALRCPAAAATVRRHPIGVSGAYRECMTFDRITRSVDVMGGKPCIRGTRVTVGTIVGLIATGSTFDDITTAYPYLTDDDIRQALSYAAWRVEEIEIPLPAA